MMTFGLYFQYKAFNYIPNIVRIVIKLHIVSTRIVLKDHGNSLKVAFPVVPVKFILINVICIFKIVFSFFFNIDLVIEIYVNLMFPLKL